MQHFLMAICMTTETPVVFSMNNNAHYNLDAVGLMLNLVCYELKNCGKHGNSLNA